MSALSKRDRWIFEAFMNAVLAILLLIVHGYFGPEKVMTQNAEALMVEMDRWKNE